MRDNAGSTPIPRDGFVVSTTGSARAWARDQLRKGRNVAVSLKLTPLEPSTTNPWTAAEDILGAGPIIVRAGRIDITATREKMLPAFASDRHPRSAVASLADGRILLAVVDGRQTAKRWHVARRARAPPARIWRHRRDESRWRRIDHNGGSGAASSISRPTSLASAP